MGRGVLFLIGFAPENLEFCFKQSQQDISLDDQLSNVPAPVSLICSLQWQLDIACETGNPRAGLAARASLPSTRAPLTGLYRVWALRQAGQEGCTQGQKGTECQHPGDKDGPETHKACQKGLRGQACFLPRGLLRTLRDPRGTHKNLFGKTN